MGAEDSKRPKDSSDSMTFSDSKRPINAPGVINPETTVASSDVLYSKTPISNESVTRADGITESSTAESLENQAEAEFTEKVLQYLGSLPRSVREMVKAAGDSLDEMIRDPRFRKVVALGLAAAVAASLVPWNLGNESKVTEEKKPEPKTAKDSSVSEEKIIKYETAVAASELGELVMFENIRPRVNEITKPYYEKAVRFVENNKDLRGAERHTAMVSIYSELLQDIIEAKKNGMSADDIETLELSRMGAYHELNAKVKAGDYTDIVESGIKVGKISPDKAKEAMTALSRSGKDIKIDTENMTMKVDGQVVNVSGEDLFGQIIGNKPFFTEIGENQGTALGAGVYDMERLDPEAASGIKKDPEIVRQLVESNWQSISDNLRAKGIDVDSDTQKYFNLVVESIVSGNSQEIFLDSSDERRVLMDQGDFDVFGWEVDIQTQLKEILNLPILPSVRIEMTRIEEFSEARAVMSSDVDIFAGHISKEMLCEGNYSLIIRMGDVEVYVSPAIVEKVVRTGDINILWFAIIPFLIPPIRKPEPIPVPEYFSPIIPKKEIGGPDVKGGDIIGHLRKGGRRVKEKPEAERHHPGGQVTLGGSSYTPGGTDKNPSGGRNPRNQEGRFGNNKRSKERHK